MTGGGGLFASLLWQRSRARGVNLTLIGRVGEMTQPHQSSIRVAQIKRIRTFFYERDSSFCKPTLPAVSGTPFDFKCDTMPTGRIRFGILRCRALKRQERAISEIQPNRSRSAALIQPAPNNTEA